MLEIDRKESTLNSQRWAFFDSLAIDVLFSDHPKRVDLIFLWAEDFIGNLRLLKQASVEDK